MHVTRLTFSTLLPEHPDCTYPFCRRPIQDLGEAILVSKQGQPVLLFCSFTCLQQALAGLAERRRARRGLKKGRNQLAGLGFQPGQSQRGEKELD